MIESIALIATIKSLQKTVEAFKDHMDGPMHNDGLDEQITRGRHADTDTQTHRQRGYISFICDLRDKYTSMLRSNNFNGLQLRSPSPLPVSKIIPAKSRSRLTIPNHIHTTRLPDKTSKLVWAVNKRAPHTFQKKNTHSRCVDLQRNSGTLSLCAIRCHFVTIVPSHS